MGEGQAVERQGRSWKTVEAGPTARLLGLGNPRGPDPQARLIEAAGLGLAGYRDDERRPWRRRKRAAVEAARRAGGSSSMRSSPPSRLKVFFPDQVVGVWVGFDVDSACAPRDSRVGLMAIWGGLLGSPSLHCAGAAIPVSKQRSRGAA